ncbi:DNA polymerase alpha, subunit B [Trametes elegans]|nr:DNA polymerase alpha, subunit B [Trametes elegans]
MAEGAAKIEAELKENFGEDIEENLLAECAKVCQNNNISGEDLFYKWEVVRMKDPHSHFALRHLADIKAMIHRDLVKATATKKFSSGNLSGLQSRQFGVPPGRGGGRPGLNAGAGSRGGMPGTPAKQVRAQDGFDLPRAEERKVPVAGPSRVNFVGPPTDEDARKKRSYRYMYEKVSERSEVLDDRIDYIGDLVKSYYDVEKLGDPSAVTEEEVMVVGRIVHDAESASSGVKLNEASLVLESSRMMGSGARVPLKFDAGVQARRGPRGAGGQGFFPGAIVALKGNNGGGGAFLVTEILSLPPLESSSGVQIKSETGQTQFTMCIACGPFTPDADLAYRPLQSLFTKLASTKPAVLLLVGPFIDATHPAIKAGDVEVPPREMFATHFADRLGEFLDASPGSIALLVPSPRDILSDHAVFPQNELPRALSSDPRIRLLPNPARFTVNGVHVAVSSVDVLFHLRKEECWKRASDVDPLPSTPGSADAPDAMANLCRHVLQQRSFYPIFPVPLDLAHEVNLDVTHSESIYLSPQDDKDDSEADARADPTRAPCAPDVLIMPSRLKHFSKVVDNTVAINPSWLTKSTYAVLDYAGHTSPGPAKDRIKVEIQRLET